MLAAMFVFFVVGLGLIIGAKMETPAAEPTDEAAAVATVEGETEAEATETAVDALVGDETATEAEPVEPTEVPAVEESAPEAEPVEPTEVPAVEESAPEAEPAA